MCCGYLGQLKWLFETETVIGHAHIEVIQQKFTISLIIWKLVYLGKNVMKLWGMTVQFNFPQNCNNWSNSN